MISGKEIPPESCSCAFVDTVVAPDADPNALLLAAMSTPALTVVVPVNELLPDNVRVLLPVLTTEPPEPEIIPAKVVSAAPPAVSVPPPSVIAALESLVVDVAIDATVSLNPARLNVPLLPTSNAEVLAILFDAPSAITPADAVVAPVYELSPDKVSVPDPVLVNPLLPDITPL
jgi:hypothetical protein